MAGSSVLRLNGQPESIQTAGRRQSRRGRIWDMEDATQLSAQWHSSSATYGGHCLSVR